MSKRRTANLILSTVIPAVLFGVFSQSVFSQVPKELDIYWRVDVARHGAVVSTYEGAGFCPATTIPAECGNNVYLPPNEAGLFERACGAEMFTFTIEPEDDGLQSATCQGNGPWELVITAKLQDVHGNPQGDFPVNFTMEVTRDTTTHRP